MQLVSGVCGRPGQIRCFFSVREPRLRFAHPEPGNHQYPNTLYWH